MDLDPCNDPFSLTELASRIRRSSNFRFDWQFYRCIGIDLDKPSAVREILDLIIATDGLHRFLRESFKPMYDEAFAITPVHEHCQILDATNVFENTLARAANDHLGAYSRDLREANPGEKQAIEDLFSQLGDYRPYELVPGNIPGCPVCDEYNHHLFSTWFYDVAWDWCLFVAWPKHSVLWMGCLTDTD